MFKLQSFLVADGVAYNGEIDIGIGTTGDIDDGVVIVVPYEYVSAKSLSFTERVVNIVFVLLIKYGNIGYKLLVTSAVLQLECFNLFCRDACLIQNLYD